MRRLEVVVAVLALVVAGAGISYAATFTLTTQHLGGAAVTTPVMFPVSVTIANKGGGTAGKPENGDIITLVFSQPVDEPTLCSGWSNSSSTQLVNNIQWSINNGVAPAHDTLSATGTSPTCPSGLHLGSIDLGSAGYNAGTTAITYNTTTTALSVTATTTLTVTLNGQSKGASAGKLTGAGAATWTPDSTVTDRSSHATGANLAVTSSTTQF